MNKVIKQTPFEIAQGQAKAGTLKTPIVGTAQGKIDYFRYQLIVHKFQLSLASKGMIPTRGWKLKPIKEYYGLKGRTAKNCLPQFIEIMENYIKNLTN